MFIKIFLIMILPFLAIANTQFYTIKLAAYKSLPNLQKNILKLSPSLQNSITIDKVGLTHKAFVKPTTDKAYLNKILPNYKKIFTDAFITTINKPSNKVIQTEDKKPKERVIIKEKSESSFYDKIQQKELYLCSHGKSSGGKKLLFRVAFTKDKVAYTPIIGKVPPIEAEYRVKDNKLYLFQKGMFNPKVYSKLEEIASKYYLISSWIEKHKSNTMRYYFDLEDARAYLKSVK